jgi:hypothetical protein
VGANRGFSFSVMLYVVTPDAHESCPRYLTLFFSSKPLTYPSELSLLYTSLSQDRPLDLLGLSSIGLPLSIMQSQSSVTPCIL